MDENDPIYKAIDKGGGQACDVEGVVRELAAAGYVIVPLVPTQGMRIAGHDALVGSEFVLRDLGGCIGYAAFEEVWAAMIRENPTPRS